MHRPNFSLESSQLSSLLQQPLHSLDLSLPVAFETTCEGSRPCPCDECKCSTESCQRLPSCAIRLIVFGALAGSPGSSRVHSGSHLGVREHVMDEDILRYIYSYLTGLRRSYKHQSMCEKAMCDVAGAQEGQLNIV